MYIGNSFNYSTYLNSYLNSPFVNKNSVSSILGKASSNSFFPSSIFSSSNDVKTADSSAMSFVQGLKTGAAGLKSAVNALSSSSAFTQKTAVSSDTDKMSVKMDNSRYTYTDTAKSVKIEQLATGQVNTGESLNSNLKASPADVGAKQFSIDIGGKSNLISVDIKDSDTNVDIQEKMADAINKAGVGIKATVDEADGRSTLKLAATETGVDANAQFTLKDTVGSLVEKTGVANVTREAEDAIYYLNGSKTAKTSKSNTVDIGGGVTATFKEVSDEDIKISKTADPDAAIDKVKKFADAYNNLFKTVRDYDDSMGDKLFSKLIAANKVYASSLSKVGIGFDSKGEMTLDTDKLTKAAEDGSLEKLFSEGINRNYGYSAQISKIAGDVSRNTGKYVSKDTMAANLIFNTFGYYNPYQNKNTTSDNSLGLLLDFMF